METNKSILIVSFALLILFVASCTSSSQNNKQCTAEASICPDGSSVSRTEPNCEFAPCPTTNKNILNILCTPSNATGSSEREIKISKDGKYYQLTYVNIMTAIDHTTGEKTKVRRVMLDAPQVYYERNGSLVSFCGGLVVQSDDSFCTEILPKLEFENDDLCLNIIDKKELKEADSNETKSSTSKMIDTGKGVLTISHKDGKATLKGKLERSTPCVNWSVEVSQITAWPMPVKGAENITNTEPYNEVTIRIFNKNTNVICIQVLGEPQEVNTVIEDIGGDTNYEVYFEDKEIFSGKIEE